MFISLLLVLYSGTLRAQNGDSLSIPVSDSSHVSGVNDLEQGLADQPDTIQTSLWPALVRSALVPGWGQIEQEHPGRAVILYGLSMSCLYNAVYNYQWYHKTNNETNKDKADRFAIAFLSIYAINLADVIISHKTGNDKPWPEDLYSDTPMKSPWGAVARSAMLPGWGQCYNESYIKSVIAFGTSFYFISQIVTNERKYKDTGEVKFRDQRVTNSWYFGLTYFLIMVDAYIDAYLYRFDDAVNFSYDYLPLDNTFRLGVHIVF